MAKQEKRGKTLEELREQYKPEKETDLPDFKPLFVGRTAELQTLADFMKNDAQRICVVYGVQMIGKTTLVRQFVDTLTGYQIKTIRFQNPENPELTFQQFLDDSAIDLDKPLLLVIENFEEALAWHTDKEHLHEIKLKLIKDNLDALAYSKNVRIILESRFAVKINSSLRLEIKDINRKELYTALNQAYRQNSVTYEVFEKLCNKLNDHVWLVSLAMQNEWDYEYVEEAIDKPEAILKLLWNKINLLLSRLNKTEKVLLYAFTLRNPMTAEELVASLSQHTLLKDKKQIEKDAFSLRKKLFLDYKPTTYEINPFLREVCFTFMTSTKEAAELEKIAFFKTEKPKYNKVKQAQEQGDYGAFYRLVKEMRKDKKYDEVHDILNNALQYDQIINKAGVLNEIGVTYKWQGNLAKAKEIFTELVEKHKHIPAFNELAILYKQEGNLAKAKEILEKACALGNIHSFNELAMLYKQEGNLAKAKEVVEKALKIEPNNVKVLNELAILYKQEGNLAKAKEVLEKALKIEPNNVKVLNELAITYKQEGNLAKAKEILEKALEIEPNNVKVLNELAITYKQEGNLEKAKEILEKALKINDKDVKTLNELAITYKQEGNLEKAKEMVEKALKIAPNDKYLPNLKKAILSAQKKEKEMNNYEKALALVNQLAIPDYFSLMKELVGDKPALIKLQNKFIMGKTDEDFYDQLKSFAEMELKGKEHTPKAENKEQNPVNSNQLKELYELLDKKLNDEDLNLFCMLHFDEVHSNFAQGQSKRIKITNLLDYAKRKELLDKLGKELADFLKT